MKIKVILVVIFLGTMKVFSQGKIAYVNYSEIIKVMPEYIQVQDSIQKAQIALQNEMTVLEEEYKKKYNSFVNESNNLVESVKIRRMQEIKDISDRAELFHDQSQKQLQQTYERLLVPIQKKIREAIRIVGNESNFIYILEETGLLYISPSAINATSLVKQKLRIKK